MGWINRRELKVEEDLRVARFNGIHTTAGLSEVIKKSNTFHYEALTKERLEKLVGSLYTKRNTSI